jgi:hypothetical protein
MTSSTVLNDLFRIEKLRKSLFLPSYTSLKLLVLSKKQEFNFFYSIQKIDF